jgi:transcription initiation factor TFIIIB Brf1 subunit/transcription initiation factor TFIIB
MSGTPVTPVPRPEDLAYIERVRLATRRISEGRRDDVAPAVEELRGTRFDLGVPTGSRRKEVELLKAALNKVLSRYVRYVTAQLESFAAKLVKVAEALASRAESLQETGDELLARVSAIEERLSRLEKRPAPGGQPEQAGRLQRARRAPGAKTAQGGSGRPSNQQGQ